MIIPRGAGLGDVDLQTCISLQCGMPGSMEDRFACSQAGYVGSRSCGDPACAPWFASLQSYGYCGGGISMNTTPTVVSNPTTYVVSPTVTVPTVPTVPTVTSVTSVTPSPAVSNPPVQVVESGRVVTLDPVKTAVVLKRDTPDATPVIEDGTPVTMVPATVQLPNVWDRLDPTKQTLLWKEGPARALPVFVGRNFVDALTPPVSPAAAGSDEGPGGQVSPWLLVAGLVLVASLMGDRK
jgi:hypothetical protein